MNKVQDTYKDASAYDHVHCDQFGIDFEGNPIAGGLTGTGSDAGLKAHAPYTVNPMVVDLYTLGKDPVKRNMMLQGNPLQGRLIQAHTRLGARPIENWSCACYLPEVGNTAEPGTVVSWAESSAVNYGNSVLGLRINRMATGMEILCGIAGKVPVFGMLTDEGRKAKWHIDVKLSKEPHWGVASF